MILPLLLLISTYLYYTFAGHITVVILAVLFLVTTKIPAEFMYLIKIGFGASVVCVGVYNFYLDLFAFNMGESLLPLGLSMLLIIAVMVNVISNFNDS